MPSYWRSPETIEQLNRLERPGFAVEFLRRNAGYRRDYARTLRQIAGASITDAAQFGARPPMGVVVFVHDPDIPAGDERGSGAGSFARHADPRRRRHPASTPSRRSIRPSLARSWPTGREIDGRERHNRRRVRRTSTSGCRSDAGRADGPDSAADRWRLRAAPRYRIAVLSARLRGQRIDLLPRALQLTPLTAARLIQLLHAHDVQELGGGPREIAAEALGSLQATLPSVEWKDSSGASHGQPSDPRLDRTRERRLSADCCAAASATPPSRLRSLTAHRHQLGALSVALAADNQGGHDPSKIFVHPQRLNSPPP